ncbi:hypothetical protein C0995_013226 [Termitomyces sp. Mi166|nr:hypothetical protein C0995_013226 [Termitomyces sp. Mi166\
MAQALAFTSDFKLGHYMKGTRINGCGAFQAIMAMDSPTQVHVHRAGTTQLGVQAWMFTNIE